MYAARSREPNSAPMVLAARPRPAWMETNSESEYPQPMTVVVGILEVRAKLAPPEPSTEREDKRTGTAGRSQDGCEAHVFECGVDAVLVFFCVS